MASMYTFDGNIGKAMSVRIAIVIITTALIVLQLPRSSSPISSIDVKKAWTSEALVAPYEMPILKPEARLQAERDSVLRLLTPYYQYDGGVGERQTEYFRKRNANGIDGLPKSFINTISRKISEIYEVGIIDQATFSKYAADTLATVFVVNGNSTRKVLVSTLFTPVTAYEFFFHDAQMAAVRPQLQQCNLNDYLMPNLNYDSVHTNSARNDLLKRVSANTGFIMKGEKIVDKGDVVTEAKALKIKSYYAEMTKNASDFSAMVTTIGQIIFVLLVMSLLTIYLHLFRGDYFDKPRSLAMVYVLVTIFPMVVGLLMKVGVNSNVLLMLPYAMVPMFIRVFLDSRTAVMSSFAMIMICSIAVPDQSAFVVTQVLSCIVAVYTLRELSGRSQMFYAAFYVTLVNIVALYSLHLMLPGDDYSLDMGAVQMMMAGGVALLLVYPLMFLIEKLFGFTSAVTLIELSDTNKELLRGLSEVAPGTFQHSIMVGNLAAAIASKVGAKSLLVRTGALYHDIGKTTNPAFFTENQAGVSPHDRMTPIESAQVIISHVSEGLRLADKYGLPEVIKDFIRTHHGTGMAKYFYITYKNEHPDQEVDTSFFSYAGPNPFTLEQAILMMADSVEAASRSLDEYTEENITNLVTRIIDAQVAEGYFHECPITFAQIATAKAVLIDKLKSIYHTRISYPTLKEA